MRLRLSLVVVGTAMAMLVHLPGVGWAADCERKTRGICGEASGSNFGVGGTQSQEGEPGASSAGSSSGGAPVGPRTMTRYAPTCTGNTAESLDGLCDAALTCPDPDEVKFWKWQSREIDGEWTPWTLVDTVCLGPDDPAVDPAVAIPAIVQRDFQRVVVLKGGAEVTPRPDTLVNVVTKFRTDAPVSYEIPLSILGQSVVITAKAEKHTWHFGDGQTATSYAADGYAEHTYAHATIEQAYVVITWSGTFSVNGGPSRPITGTVQTTGDAVDVVVREARSELVRD